MSHRHIPFGYRLEQGRLSVHDQEAEVVQQIFDLYINGHGYTPICAHLNIGDVPYRPGTYWNKNMVKRILENRRYIGEQDFPAIIPAADFDAVAARKAGNPHCYQQRKRKPSHDYSYTLLPYQPTSMARRLENDISRALERSPDPQQVRPLIFACAAEKYASIGCVFNG